MTLVMLSMESRPCPLGVCRDFLPYMQSEIVELGDTSMEQEVQTLLKLLSSPTTLEP